jgi:DNA-binding NarL/FixJ family response regulator
MQPIKVLIVKDDSDLVNKIIKMLDAEADFAVVGICNNKLSAVKMVAANYPDIILINLSLTASLDDGIETIKEITKFSQVKALAIIDFGNEDLMKQVCEAGVKDYIYQNQLHWLNDKIRDVYYRHSPTEVLLDKLNQLEKETRFNRLTPSEKEILILLKAGFSVDEIVGQLCKSKKTVHNQKSSFLKKLGATCYKEAIEKYKDFIG